MKNQVRKRKMMYSTLSPMYLLMEDYMNLMDSKMVQLILEKLNLRLGLPKPLLKSKIEFKNSLNLKSDSIFLLFVKTFKFEKNKN